MAEDHASPNPLDNIWLVQQMIEINPSPILLVDALQPDMPIIYVNTAFEQDTGYNRNEIIGKNCRFLQQDDRDQPDLDIIRKALKEGTSCTVTLRNYRKDGELFWNELNIVPIQNSNGMVTHFIGVQKDITERKRFEDALYQSEARYRAVIEDQMELICCIAPDMTLTFVNEAYCHNYGKTSDELLGQNFLSLIPEELQRQAKEHLKSLSPENPVKTFEHWVTRDDGQRRYQQWTDHAIFNNEGEIIEYQSIGLDITERKQAEDALRESEALYRTMAHHFPNGIAGLYNHDLVYELVDGQGLEQNGLTKAHFEGKRLRDTFPPDVYERDEPALLAALRGETTENIVPFGDKTFLVITLPVKNDVGEIIKGMVITQDITAIQRANEQLKQSQELFRTLIDASPDAIVVHRDNTILYISPTGIQMLGAQSKEDVIGQDILKYVHPDYRASVLERTRHVMQTNENINFAERRILRVDGTYFYAETTSRRIIYLDGKPALLSIVHDIAERKQMEDALRQSEEKFRALVENSNDFITRLTRDSTHLYVNPAYLRAMGFTEAQVIGKRNADIGVPTDTQIIFDEARERVFKEKTDFMLDFSYVMEGQERWLSVRITPEFDINGDVQTVMTITRDITELKTAQQNELQLQMEKERLRLLSDFIDNTAHEFRTPLASISTSAYLMGRLPDPEKRAQKAEQIKAQVKRMTHIMSMLQKMTRLEITVPKFEKTNISDFVRYVCDEMQTKEPLLSILLNLDDQLPEVNVDIDLLHDALEPIIENAFRYSPPNAPITISTTCTNSHAYITVKDHGPGIPEEIIPSIFETFWRSDAAHSTPGLGLGLSIAHRIVQMHHGEIQVESTLNEGSIFHIMLPING